MKPKISLITLGVRDLDRAVAFYRDGLKLPLHGGYASGDEVAFFALEGTWLALYGRDDLARDARVPAEGSGFAGITLAHNEPSKEGVDRVYAEALAAGAAPLNAPRDVSWGGYVGYFADPDGHLWEVCWNPQMDLT